MSIDLMSLVFRMDLPPTDKLVLLALADAARDDGCTWIPVRRRKEELDRQGRKKLDLLMKTGLGERALQMAIKRLVEANFLQRNEKAGKGVDYVVTPASDAGRILCGPHGKTKRGASNAGKPSVTVKSLIECPDDFWPKPKTESETAKRMEEWSPRFTAQQVEKFVAYHQARGTKSRNWDRNWTTWALNNFDGKDRNDNERAGNRQSSNDFAVAAASFAARSRAGACPD